MKCSHILKRIFQLLALKQSLAGVRSRHLESGIDSTVTVMLVACLVSWLRGKLSENYKMIV